MRNCLFSLLTLEALRRKVLQLLRLLSWQRWECECLSCSGTLHPGCKQALPAWDSHLTHLLKGQSVLALSLEENSSIPNNLHSSVQKNRIPSQTYCQMPPTFSLAAVFILCPIVSQASKERHGAKLNKIPRMKSRISLFLWPNQQNFCEVMYIKRHNKACSVCAKPVPFPLGKRLAQEDRQSGGLKLQHSRPQPGLQHTATKLEVWEQCNLLIRRA